MHAKYPDIPSILNNLACCYQGIGDSKTAIALMKKLTERFPNYLFGLISLALTALDDNDHDVVPIIFTNCFDLKELYPERDEFHVTEVISFAIVMGIYFSRINDSKTARLYYNLLDRLADKNDPRCFQLMKEILAVENQKNKSK